MYSSSSSSSSRGSMGPRDSGGSLGRYTSAPESLLSTTADSVRGRVQGVQSHATTNHARSNRANEFAAAFRGDLQSSNRSSGGAGMIPLASASSASLARQTSSPADFLNALASPAENGGGGFSVSRCIIGSSSSSQPDNNNNNNNPNAAAAGSLFSNSQLNFSTQNNNNQLHFRQVAGGNAWNDTTTTSNPSSITFSSHHHHHHNSNNNNFSILESQLQFGLSPSAIDASTMVNMIEIPQDSVPCKVRAKRGCATHPRSIAERERRTRISEKLKRLQELVPNMDTQTSYADMLELAVQHIKGLQSQVKSLHTELENCKCGCKK